MTVQKPKSLAEHGGSSDLYLEGLELFNRAAFYDAHEVLEDVWRGTTGEERKFLQGLIQAAVAFHHHSTGNLRGACSLLSRGMMNLARYPETYGGVRLDLLLASLRGWQEALAGNLPTPALPQITRSGKGQKL